MSVLTEANLPVPLRPPGQVMRLARLGSAHPTRLSFMRVLLRRLKFEGWCFERTHWSLGENGEGAAAYRARGPQRCYTLVCFAHDLPDHLRSDRVIAEAWDATFTLFDGEPTPNDIERLSGEVPRQEAGRMSGTELVLSRANRSVRLFEHVVDALAAGGQPEASRIEEVGYLMRTTAVYGGGKFGVADRDVWCEREEFQGSFQPELLTVWLIRAFSVDLVEHLAKLRAPATAIALEPGLRRRLGVGNSTGLGMAPFLITHPLLFNNWVLARETALAAIRGRDKASEAQWRRFRLLVSRSQLNVSRWTSSHPIQVPKVRSLTADLERLAGHLATAGPAVMRPWDELYRWAENNLGLEAQELLVALLLEIDPVLVDPLARQMVADEASHFAIAGRQRLTKLMALIECNYRWAVASDYQAPEAQARVWYVSAEKLEPRLGERFEEELDVYEQALAPGRDVSLLRDDALRHDADASVGEFLLQYPQHRHAVRRVQLSAISPYGEIQDNTIAAAMLPIDMLRCKLAFFGATRFDPRSDRWVRITMYQGAPFPHELGDYDPDELAYPVLAPDDELVA